MEDMFLEILSEAYGSDIAYHETESTINALLKAMQKAYELGKRKVNNSFLDDVSNCKEQKPIKYKCLFCQRSFNRRIPHNCKGGFRKRKIEWEPIYE